MDALRVHSSGIALPGFQARSSLTIPLWYEKDGLFEICPASSDIHTFQLGPKQRSIQSLYHWCPMHGVWHNMTSDYAVKTDQNAGQGPLDQSPKRMI